MQSSECQSGAELKQTRVNGASIYDSLKVTSSARRSNGNLKQAWVNGGPGHDSLKLASALNFQRDGNSNTSCSCWAVAQRQPGGGLCPALPVPRIRVPAGDRGVLRWCFDRTHLLDLFLSLCADGARQVRLACAKPQTSREVDQDPEGGLTRQRNARPSFFDHVLCVGNTMTSRWWRASSPSRSSPTPASFVKTRSRHTS